MLVTKKTEVKTFKYTAKCDCGGEYLPDGTALLSNPKQYRHYCTLCDDVITLRDMYPLVKYEEFLT